jgi:SET and MYND domain-containing protein
LLLASQAGDQTAAAKLAQLETLATYPIETASHFRSETHLLRAQELHGRVLHAFSTIGTDPTPISLECITKLIEIESVNSYGLPAPLLPGAENEADRRLRGSGVYSLASRVNHECLPNVARFDDFDGASTTAPGSNAALSLRTLHALPAGEEITQSYFPLTWSFLQRQERCREQYGFICRCPRCTEEATWPPEEQGAETPEDVALVKEMSNAVLTANMMDIPGVTGKEKDLADAGYIHVFLFKYICPREGCGGTMAPLSQHQSHELQCNVCGNVRTEAEFLAELEASS